MHEPRANPREEVVVVVVPRESLERGLDRGLGLDRSRGRGQVVRWAGPGGPVYWTGVPVGGGTYCSQGQGCGMRGILISCSLGHLGARIVDQEEAQRNVQNVQAPDSISGHFAGSLFT